MTIEQVQSLFFDSKALREPAYNVQRTMYGGNRFYFARNTKGEIMRTAKGSMFFQSVTTFIKNSQPTPVALQKWQADLGWEKAKYEGQLAADYGTLMHIYCAKLLIDRKVNLDTLIEDVQKYREGLGYGQHLDKDWTERLQSDLLSFHQWVKDYDVRPLAVEITLVSQKLGIAGTIDLPCEMNEKLYTEKTEASKRKRVNAIVDFKSGRKGFHDDYEVQLAAYKEMWAENFPEVPISGLYNWAPKEWRKEPTYSFKDQTDATNVQLLKHFISIAELKQANSRPAMFDCGGVLDLDADNSANYSYLNEEELIDKLKHSLDNEQN